MKELETMKQLEAIPSRHQTSGICCGIWYAQLGYMGLIELCDIKRMRLILSQMVFYFGSFFWDLKSLVSDRIICFTL